MNILESEIEEILFKNLGNRDLLIERGFEHFEQHYYLHPNFGSYGIPDIIGVTVSDYSELRNRCVSITIYELKKEVINIETLLQASRYAKAVTVMFQEYGYNLFNDFEIKIVLIGKTVENNSDFVFLSDFCQNVFLLTYSIDIKKGIVFKEESDFYIKNAKNFVFTNFISDLKKGLLHIRYNAKNNQF